MLTGVETAGLPSSSTTLIALQHLTDRDTGLVLAMLPLIISALEHYNEGWRPLRDFVKYKQVIRQIVTDLSTQEVLFRNTLELLLSGSVASDTELKHLLEHPSGEAWHDEALGLDLKRRLQDSFLVYMESVQDMQSLLDTLRGKVGLDSYGNVCTSSDLPLS